MRTYTYMVFAVLSAFLLSLNTINVFSLDEMSLFLTVIGLIYGLISAFTINNAWERFSKIRDAIAEETNSLITANIFAKKLSDKVSATRMKDKIIEYCLQVPEIEWRDYWKSEKTHRTFRQILELFANIKLKTQKDVELFDDIGDELRDASAARNSQLVLSQTKISKVQWILNIFLSGILITGLILTSLPNYLLSIFIVSSMIAAVLMILIVIYELESMKLAEEEVSNEPYRQVVRIIKSDECAQ
ncbi:MAG: DUF4239 domain-containing protein [Nanoarchaeota archaeon]|nr:DUF4239 domain-containing protein [Nanoarchaeota archaeon]MBU4299587.1 DUF4239 domain-containing protein [Nanoarchaeota archaeon]MBU4452106.1 DUF4239 domain-containing protein [Nanoarchaeota archaeon]MCG2723726.1 DUF4239 domain-containing protein [archaeon]